MVKLSSEASKIPENLLVDDSKVFREAVKDFADRCDVKVEIDWSFEYSADQFIVNYFRGLETSVIDEKGNSNEDE